MTERHDRADDPLEAVEHPVETAKSLAVEADRGHSPRTPMLAINGVALAVLLIVAVVLAGAVIAYLVA